MKVLFLSSLDVAHLQSGSWRLLRDLRCTVEDDAGQSRSYRVPEGFETDFASVPRLPFVYLVFGGMVVKAAVLHDWLYSGGEDNAGRKASRAEADEIFKDAMQSDGVSWWRRQLMHAGVRLFGGSRYQAAP